MTVLNDKELMKFEAERDFSAELLASVEQMVAGNSVLKAKELKEFEKGRNIDAEILQAIEEIRSGVATVEHVIQIPDVSRGRNKPKRIATAEIKTMNRL